MKSIVFALSLMSSVAFAASSPLDAVTVDSPACYGVTYSDAHMAKPKHASQTVKSMNLKFEATEYSMDGQGYLLNVEALIKTSSNFKKYSNVMFCNQNGNEISCGIECDGGSATVKYGVSPAKNGQIVLVNNGFVLYGGCGEEVDEADSVYLENTPGGDDIFVLSPQACK